jgi:hypothetical protein
MDEMQRCFMISPCPMSVSRGEGRTVVPIRTAFETAVRFYFGFHSENIYVNQRQENRQGFLFLVCL